MLFAISVLLCAKSRTCKLYCFYVGELKELGNLVCPGSCTAQCMTATSPLSFCICEQNSDVFD